MSQDSGQSSKSKIQQFIDTRARINQHHNTRLQKPLIRQFYEQQEKSLNLASKAVASVPSEPKVSKKRKYHRVFDQDHSDRQTRESEHNDAIIDVECSHQPAHHHFVPDSFRPEDHFFDTLDQNLPQIQSSR